MRSQSVLNKSIQRMVFDVTSVLLPGDDESKKVIPTGGEESDSEEPLLMREPAKREQPRSSEVYNGPRDLDDLDVFSRRSTHVDSRIVAEKIVTNSDTEFEHLAETYNAKRQLSKAKLERRKQKKSRAGSQDIQCSLCDDHDDNPHDDAPRRLSSEETAEDDGRESEVGEHHGNAKTTSEDAFGQQSNEDAIAAPAAAHDDDDKSEADPLLQFSIGATSTAGKHKDGTSRRQRRISSVALPYIGDSSSSVKSLEKLKASHLSEADQEHVPRGRKKGGVRTRARRSLSYRSYCSRVTYSFLLCNLVVWIPVWLKLISVERNLTDDHHVSIFNASVGLDLWVSTFDTHNATCTRCDLADDWTEEFGVTYDVQATVEDYWVGQGISSASYIALLASYNFKDWFIVSRPGILTSLPTGDSVNEVCRAEPMPRDDDEEEDDRVTEPPVVVEEFDDDSVISRCCLDRPGFIYLVACATPFEYLVSPKDPFYWRLKHGPKVSGGTTLEGTCVQVHGRCGSACGADARVPIPGTCIDGVIPKDLLIDKRYVDLSPTASPTSAPSSTPRPTTQPTTSTPTPAPSTVYRPTAAPTVSPAPTISPAPTPSPTISSPPTICPTAAATPSSQPTVVPTSLPSFPPTSANETSRRQLLGNKRRHFDSRRRFSSRHKLAYHGTFVCLVTMMAVGTWVSFLAGCGTVGDDVKPTMSCVEVYMAADEALEKKPLFLCAFSISASEGPMMILRNFCGKLMSWVYQRKFVMVMQNSSMDDVFAETADPRAGFTKKHHKKNHEIEDATLKSHAEFVDIFQDEGHRVGAYALWDAFVSLVNDSDLRFLECMANKMGPMTADDTMLLGKKEDDGKCFDDELRNMAEQKDVGISTEDIALFELAFATCELLTALGHHAFWRADSSKLKVTAFRDLVGDTEAVEALLLWAANFKQERKKSGKLASPFAPHCAPTDHPGISANVWNGWWLLYDEMGRIQWSKRYDVTKFCNCRLNYYRKDGENVTHDLMMCYSARANPEDLHLQLSPTIMKRGVAPGVFVRLKQTDRDDLLNLYAWLGIQPLSRSTARRCHARVVGSRFTMFEKGRRSKHKESTQRARNLVFVKVKECTPEFLSVLPKRYLTNFGQSTEIDTKKYHKALAGYKFEGEEAIVPLACITPLRESRGKSGGMNHAMEIINYYLRYESATFRLLEAKRMMKKRRKKKTVQVPENSVDNPTEACLLFAIFDCRHMAVQGFWNAVIPYFFHYRDETNPWSTNLEIDHNVAFVQLPQSFSSLTIEDDIFDMRNEYLFRLANNIRSGVGAITSCGTNAVWNYDIKFQQDPLEHRFNEDTMIEDTASSHDVIIAGRKGVYHFERLVLGARKGTTDYLAAVFRWSKGAVQLFWTTFWYPRYQYKWPFAMICVHVLPTVGCVVYLQLQKLDRCHHTFLAAKLGLVPCGYGPFVGVVGDPLFILYVATMIAIVVTTFRWPRLGAYTVMFENVTYFFASLSAFYWAAMPCVMCIAKNGVPPAFDTQLLTAGALWLQLHSGLLINIIKSWSPLENGCAPSDQSLLRSQQMYLVTAPLHAVAIFQGMKEGFEICFLGKDASRWGSFDSATAMSTVKLWVVAFMGMLLTSIGFGIYNLITVDHGHTERGTRALGIFFCVILLYIVNTPIRAMFFYERVIKEKQKPSCIDRLTKALFGKKQPIRPDYIYIALWIALLCYTLRRSEIDQSDGIFNGRSRCSIDSKEPGCRPDDLYREVRNPNKGIIP